METSTFKDFNGPGVFILGKFCTLLVAEFFVDSIAVGRQNTMVAVTSHKWKKHLSLINDSQRCQKLSDYPVGWTPHMKGVGMLVFSLRGEIFGI